MSTRARSPEVDELSCEPETQQAAGVEELVVGVEDPLQMSDTEQGDIGLETQQDSDSSEEDTQDTQAAGGTQVKGTDKGKADKMSKKAPVLFSAKGQRSKLGFYVPFNSQGHIGTGPQNCHLWDSNPQR